MSGVRRFFLSVGAGMFAAGAAIAWVFDPEGFAGEVGLYAFVGFMVGVGVFLIVLTARLPVRWFSPSDHA